MFEYRDLNQKLKTIQLSLAIFHSTIMIAIIETHQMLNNFRNYSKTSAQIPFYIFAAEFGSGERTQRKYVHRPFKN